MICDCIFVVQEQFQIHNGIKFQSNKEPDNTGSGEFWKLVSFFVFRHEVVLAAAAYFFIPKFPKMKERKRATRKKPILPLKGKKCLPNNIGELNRLLLQHDHLIFNYLSRGKEVDLSISSSKYKSMKLLVTDANGTKAYHRLVALLKKSLPLLGTKAAAKMIMQHQFQDVFSQRFAADPDMAKQ